MSARDLMPTDERAERDRAARALEQRQAALDRANRIRFARADLKRDVAAGRIHWRAALDHEAAQSMSVAAFLPIIPRIGHVASGRITRTAQIPPHARIGDLGAKRMAALVAAIRERAPRAAGR